MIRKLILYYQTTLYLKPIQIVFQVWYKIKWTLPQKKNKLISSDFSLKQLQFSSFQFIKSDNKYLGNNQFNFLNTKHDFGQQIDWHFQHLGRLWQYNLQYFDFVFDSKFDVSCFQLMIEDFSQKIIGNKIKLEPYLVSIRLVNWLLFYSKTGYESPSFKSAILIQVRFLRKNLEYHLLANHYFENLISLYISSLYLGNKELANFSSQQLEKEIIEQIQADGAHYEGSVMYHIIILSRMLIVHHLHEQNKISTDFSRQIDSTISKMYSWLQLMRFKNGDFPLFNDATIDIAIPVSIIDEYVEKQKLYFNQNKLSESGYRKLMNKRFEVVIDCANIIPSYQPGHAHADMLHCCFNHKNQPILIDPGISTYEIGKQRILEKSTSFHNTVVINDASQSLIWSSFRMASRANVFIKKEKENALVAFHDGYRKRFDVDCERTFLLEEHEFIIIDKILGNTSVQAKAYFYFDPLITIDISNHGNIVINNCLSLSTQGESSWKIEAIDIPKGYNRFVTTKRLTIEFQTTLQTKFTELVF